MENKSCCGNSGHKMHVCFDLDGCCGSADQEPQGSLPVGHILTYMGTTAPTGYLVCDGGEYNMADYSELSEHIQTQFGKYDYFGGDGAMTFAVPDLRNEFLRGYHGDKEIISGEIGIHQAGTQTLFATTGAVPGDYCLPMDIHVVEHNFERPYIAAKDSERAYVRKTGTYTVEDSMTEYNGYTVRPTNTAVLFCIKAV